MTYIETDKGECYTNTRDRQMIEQIHINRRTSRQKEYTYIDIEIYGQTDRY